MGAFILYPSKTNYSLAKAKELFKKKGFGDFSEFSLGKYNLILYSKILFPEKNFISLGTDSIYSVGTFFYKGLINKQAIKTFLEDFKENKILNNEISGTFCLIIYLTGDIFIVNDDENLYPVYHHLPTKMLSSSFLALCEEAKKLTVHKLSFIENLVTGCSFGNDTYFKEIKRIRWDQMVILPDDITFINIKKNIEPVGRLSKKEVFSSIKESINDVFKRYALFSGLYGCELGISAGYDSRLLLSLCLKHFEKDKILIGSNYKCPPDYDLRIARKIAGVAGKDIVEIPVTSTRYMSSELFEKNLYKAFHFYDGQIRVNHGWTREYRTLEYRKKVLENFVFGLSGHGGEIFRNDYNLDRYPFYYRLWIINQMIGQSGRKRIGSNLEIDLLVDYIRYKLSHIFPPDSKYIDIILAQRYYNEAWVQSGPGIRASIENQLSFYASPFTDHLISKRAYDLIPFLNIGAGYEKKLIKENNAYLFRVPFERKNRIYTIPIIYTTLLYRLGLDLHYFSAVMIKRRNKELQKYLGESYEKYAILKKILTNPELEKLISVERYSLACSNEPEIDRLIAFAYVFNYYSGKILFDLN